jgi:hypothetical protein
MGDLEQGKYAIDEKLTWEGEVESKDDVFSHHQKAL